MEVHFFFYLLLTGTILVSGYTKRPLSNKHSARVSIMVDVAEVYELRCIRVMFAPRYTNQVTQEHIIYKLLQELMKGAQRSQVPSFRSIARSTFFEFSRNVLDANKFDNCFSSLQSFVADDDTKEQFKLLCKEHFGITEFNKWIVFLSMSHPAKSFFQDIPLPFALDLLVISEPANPSGVWSVSEVFRLAGNTTVQVVPIGEWTHEKGLNVLTTSMYKRRSGLNGTIIKAGYIENWPISATREVKPRSGVFELDGLFPRIWRELEAILNFQTKAIRSVDNTTGICNYKQCNGLVGMLMSKQIEVIVSELNIIKERTNLMTFSQPLLKTRYQVYFRLPGYNPSWWAVLKPFHFHLWMMLLFWIIMAAAFIGFFYSHAMEPPNDLTLQPTNSFFFMLQSMCQQGYDQVPVTGSCRVLFVTAYMMGAIIIPSYSAALVSSLTAQKAAVPFNSLEAMLNYKKYHLLLSKNTAEYSLFALATDKVYSRVFKELVVADDVYRDSLDLIINYVCKTSKLRALFRVESTMDFVVTASKSYGGSCKIIKFRQPISTIYQAIGFDKAFPYREYIDFHLREMLRVGIVRRIQNNLWPLKPFPERSSKFKQVGIGDVIQIFALLAVGMALAVIIFAIEIIIGRKRKRQNKWQSDWTPCEFYN